jgi:hypothetical protein
MGSTARNPATPIHDEELRRDEGKGTGITVGLDFGSAVVLSATSVGMLKLNNDISLI